MKIPLIIIYAVAFILAGLGNSAPWIAKMEATVSGTQSTYVMGMQLIDDANSNFASHMTFCDADHPLKSTLTNCSDTMMIVSIMHGVGALLCLVLIPLLIKAPKAAFFISPWALILQVAGGFGYVYKVLPGFKDDIQNISAASSATWSYDWTAFVAAAGAGVTFLATIIFALSAAKVVNAPKKKPGAASTDSTDPTDPESTSAAPPVPEEGAAQPVEGDVTE